MAAYEEAKEWQRTGGKPSKTNKKEPKKQAAAPHQPAGNPFRYLPIFSELTKLARPILAPHLEIYL